MNKARKNNENGYRSTSWKKWEANKKNPKEQSVLFQKLKILWKTLLKRLSAMIRFAEAHRKTVIFLYEYYHYIIQSTQIELYNHNQRPCSLNRTKFLLSFRCAQNMHSTCTENDGIYTEHVHSTHTHFLRVECICIVYIFRTDTKNILSIMCIFYAQIMNRIQEILHD